MPSPAAQANRTIPLTVLFHESPIARAYLQTIASLGLRPRRIIHMIASKDVSTGKPVGRWLPGSLRKSYAASIQRQKIHHWPGWIRQNAEPTCRDITEAICRRFGFVQEDLDSAHAPRPLSDFSDEVVPVLTTGLEDPELHTTIAAFEEPVLFTGGGIMPASLLAIPHLRFLHVHPGYLPRVRGADGVLWSVLLYGRASASAFYMAPGIDTGEVFHRTWLPTLDLAPNSLDTTMRYRAVFSFIDPWVRAFALRDLLIAHQSYDALDARAQDEDQAMTYHFMHERLREAALAKLF